MDIALEWNDRIAGKKGKIMGCFLHQMYGFLMVLVNCFNFALTSVMSQ